MAVAAESVTANRFQVGQIWKLGDENLLVTSLGKTLVHYKKYKLQPRGVRTTLSSKSDLEELLRNRKATLVTE